MQRHMPGRACRSLVRPGILRLSATVFSTAFLASVFLAGCGAEEERSNKRTVTSHGADGEGARSGHSMRKRVRLAKASNDQVINTLVIPFGPNGFQLGRGGLGLSGENEMIRWVVDMEEREEIKAGVTPQKYLRVKGELSVPMDAENRPYEVGCLYVELKDNVFYREKTWLRLSSTGVYGDKYTEVKIPLAVNLGGWKDVPELEESITLAQFESNKLKRFDGSLCFRLDFTEAPAQLYNGEIIVQYLRPGAGDEPTDCSIYKDAPECKPAEGDNDTNPGQDDPTAPVPFACAVDPIVLKGKQKATLSWKGGMNAAADLAIALSPDPVTYQGALGSFKVTGPMQIEYTAPDRVGQNVRVLVSAMPAGVEALPAFCEVNLIGDEDIGVPDDGEIRGLVGNVFSLAPNTQKLPELDAMTPVAQVIVGNLDIPERSFSAGFPGVPNLFEWFAIRFRGQLIVPQATTCTFKLTSDDGANLYIDGAKVVDNDGVHATATKTGTVTMAAGLRQFRVDYFQGPRYHITLQLFWKCGNEAAFKIVPPESFQRPLR